MSTMKIEDLARRAVAAWTALGLEWMPGMEMGVMGSRFRLTERELWMADRPDALPNLSDHATLGCIEHGMLPAAWAGIGDNVRIDVVAADDLDEHDRIVPATCVRVLYWADGWRVLKTFTRSDTAEALVSCLEAAAERREP